MRKMKNKLKQQASLKKGHRVLLNTKQTRLLIEERVLDKSPAGNTISERSSPRSGNSQDEEDSKSDDEL